MKVRIQLLSFIVLTVFGCTTPAVISDYYTSKASGEELLMQHAPQEQIFVGESRIIRSLNGNSYELEGQMLSLTTGEVLEGEIIIKLTEYIDKTEMMLANVSTLGYRYDGNQPLSSAGSFKISFSVDGEPATPEKLCFFFPTDLLDEDMELFRGSTTENTFIWNQIVNGGGPPVAELLGTWESELGGIGNSGYFAYIRLNEYLMFDQDALYVNLDYFFASGLLLTDILVKPDINETLGSIHISSPLLFQTENAVMMGVWEPSLEGFQFPNVPVGFDVTCFGVGVTDNQEAVFGLLDFEIEQNGVYTMTMERISEQELEDILSNL